MAGSHFCIVESPGYITTKLVSVFYFVISSLSFSVQKRGVIC